MITDMSSFLDVHKRVLTYDAVSPLAQEEQYLDLMIKGGLNVVAATIGGMDTLEKTMHSISMWYERIRRRSDELMLVTDVEQMQEAKNTGKLGIIFHLQGTIPLDRDINTIQTYYQLGVRIIQLTYNLKDFVGDGCEEPGDGGLSTFGKHAIGEMNKVGMVVDLSHTGYRTTMEAMEISRDPCIFSHSNCNAVRHTNRNLQDDQIKTVASMGGVVGIAGYPYMVGDTSHPSKQQLLAHFDYMVNLVGVDHVGIGCDYFSGQEHIASLQEARIIHSAWIQSGLWTVETYPPPPYEWPEGIETPDKLPNLTRMLLEHEYSPEDIGKIWGQNFMRVYKKVWK